MILSTGHLVTTMVKKQRLSCLAVFTMTLGSQGFPFSGNPQRSFALRSVAEEANKPALSINTAPLYGGDFCGFSATFSAIDGKLIPVPEYLVPESLLEWGQYPSCLEVIVSEDFISDKLTRHTVSVAPAVGCGVDNLDTMKSKEDIDTSYLVVCDSVVAFDYHLASAASINRSETTFGLVNGHRLRVMVDVTQDKKVKTPIVIVLEKRTSETSCGGTIADGGGLDGRTVSQLLGDDFKGKPFCEAEPAQREANDGECMTVLNLPGNVTVAHSAFSGSSEWLLDVGHITEDANRRVVRRRFGVSGELQHPIEHWAETNKKQ